MHTVLEFFPAGLRRQSFHHLLLCGVLLLGALLLTGCGGGASTESNPVTNGDGSVNSSTYNGPNALTDDIRAFQVNVWDRLRLANRCGGCHIQDGQSPAFVRMDDVNIAYSEANPLIDLDSPASSRLVTKVGSGHNCWLDSDVACATAITGYIEDWVAGASGEGREIQIVAPTNIRDPGTTLSFPPPVPAEFTDPVQGLYPLLVTNCAECHSDSSSTPQQPFFGSSVPADAYEAAQSKINLNDAASSRFVIRLESEFHNCWSQCDSDAAELEAAINFLAGVAVTSDPVLPPTVFSSAITLPEGIVAAGGSRHEADVIALYEFKEGSGNITIDSSGVLPELNLTLSGTVNWVGGWGIEIVDGKAQGSTANSRKLHELITATGEYSIEAWVAPGNVVQEGPAGIVGYSAGTTARNFTLGQTQYNYDFLHRSSTTDANGEAALSTADADERLQATLQHVVVTFDPLNGRRIYVNGQFTGDADPVAAGNLNDWDDSFAFVLGNEVSGDRLWQGSIRMVAIHNRALTEPQIQQNFDVGVGEKFFLLFAVGGVGGVPDGSYIMFEVAQYDSYAYLFNQPVFINLLDNAPASIPLKRLSIGVNGKEAVVGQSFRSLDLSLDASNGYDPATGQVLSTLGTIIALENGPNGNTSNGSPPDEFFLTFEVLGTAENVVIDNSITVPPDLPVPVQVSDIGLRTFDEINASMSQITGVPVTEPNVQSTYDTVKQQLPTVETIEGFLSAHQIGISQLSIEYCNALVEDPGLRTAFFGPYGFSDFGVSVALAFPDQASKDNVVDALYEQMIGLPDPLDNTLSSAPDRIEIGEILVDGYVDGSGPVPSLFDSLSTTCGACNDTSTRTILKAMCAGVLGSAAMLVQ